MFLIVGLFIYIYFFYLGAGPAGKGENETERENVRWSTQPNDPATIAVAGFVMQEENQFPNRQNRQESLTMQEEMPFNQPNQLDWDARKLQAGPQSPYGVFRAAGNQGTAAQPFGVPEKVLQEGHWVGLEVIPLTPAVAKANNIPPEVPGVLIDEVTLLAADAGLLAGDVITAVNGKAVRDLKSFRRATKKVALSNRAVVSVYRDGNYRDVTVSGPEELGVAQMEAAPMILASSRSPHGYYGPCDSCHAISTIPVNTDQLMKDQGDSLAKVAPNIRAGTPPPHRSRGACTKCHIVL